MNEAFVYCETLELPAETIHPEPEALTDCLHSQTILMCNIHIDPYLVSSLVSMAAGMILLIASTFELLTGGVNSLWLLIASLPFFLCGLCLGMIWIVSESRRRRREEDEVETVMSMSEGHPSEAGDGKIDPDDLP